MPADGAAGNTGAIAARPAVHTGRLDALHGCAPDGPGAAAGRCALQAGSRAQLEALRGERHRASAAVGQLTLQQRAAGARCGVRSVHLYAVCGRGSTVVVNPTSLDACCNWCQCKQSAGHCPCILWCKGFLISSSAFEKTPQEIWFSSFLV